MFTGRVLLRGGANVVMVEAVVVDVVWTAPSQPTPLQLSVVFCVAYAEVVVAIEGVFDDCAADPVDSVFGVVGGVGGIGVLDATDTLEGKVAVVGVFDDCAADAVDSVLGVVGGIGVLDATVPLGGEEVVAVLHLPHVAGQSVATIGSSASLQ